MQEVVERVLLLVEKNSTEPIKRAKYFKCSNVCPFKKFIQCWSRLTFGLAIYLAFCASSCESSRVTKLLTKIQPLSILLNTKCLSCVTVLIQQYYTRCRLLKYLVCVYVITCLELLIAIPSALLHATCEGFVSKCVDFQANSIYYYGGGIFFYPHSHGTV